MVLLIALEDQVFGVLLFFELRVEERFFELLVQGEHVLELVPQAPGAGAFRILQLLEDLFGFVVLVLEERQNVHRFLLFRIFPAAAGASGVPHATLTSGGTP